MSNKNAIQDWLADFKAQPESQIVMYASALLNNGTLIRALCELFESAPLKFKHQLISPVCHQLFDFIKANEPNLTKFLFSILPSILDHYLSCIAQHRRDNVIEVESFLLALYHLCEKPLSEQSSSAQLPNITRPSVYHEPSGHGSFSLTESLLAKRHLDLGRVGFSAVKISPIESINLSNRFAVLTRLLAIYNCYIGVLPSQSLAALCRAASSVCREGYENLKYGDLAKHAIADDPKVLSPNRAKNVTTHPAVATDLDKPGVRIDLSSDFLIELLHGICFCMYNGHTELAIGALDDIHSRACVESNPEVLLVTNSMRNALQMSLASMHDPSTLQDRVSQLPLVTSGSRYLGWGGLRTTDVITLGSFRTAKLPDDIDIQTDVPDALFAEDGEVDTERSPGADKQGKRIVKIGAITLRIPKAAGMRKRRESLLGGGMGSPRAANKNISASSSEHGKSLVIPIPQLTFSRDRVKSDSVGFPHPPQHLSFKARRTKTVLNPVPEGNNESAVSDSPDAFRGFRDDTFL